ncbi:MAG: GGDEF domain-containing protein, partial [Candidatus Limnocylindria bacterium]
AGGGLTAALAGTSPSAAVAVAGALLVGAVVADRRGTPVPERRTRAVVASAVLLPAVLAAAVAAPPDLAAVVAPLRLPIGVAVGLGLIVTAVATGRTLGAGAVLAGIGVGAFGVARAGTVEEPISLLLLASASLLLIRSSLARLSHAASLLPGVQAQALPDLAAQLSDGALRFDGQLQLRDWNRSAQTLLGLEDESLGIRIEDLLGLSLAELPSGDETTLHHTPVGGLELRMRRDDRGVTVVIRDPGSTPESERLGRELRGTIEELLQARRTVELQRVEIERASTIDALTGVASRSAILDRLRIEVAQARRYQHTVAVALIDIDGFGEINREHGLAGGDAVLREAALRIRLRVREADALGRAGSDGFLAILPHTDEGGAAIYADALRRRLAQRPIAVGADQLDISVSVGVAVMRAGEDLDLDGLLGRAEEALGSARGAGGDRIALDRLHGLARLEDRHRKDEPQARDDSA